MFKTKVTSQGTISIPAPLRKKFDLQAGDIVFVEDNGAIVISKVSNFEVLRKKNARFAKRHISYKSGDGFAAHVKETYGQKK